MIWKYFKHIDIYYHLEFPLTFEFTITFKQIVWHFTSIIFYPILYNNRVQRDGKNS